MWEPFFVSAKLAIITSIILFCIGVPIAYFLAFKKFKGKFILESFITLPIILPPTVLGFYLLFFFSSESIIGEFLSDTFGIELVFNFTGLVIASCIYSFPFMIQPLRDGMKKVGQDVIEASYTLGKSKKETLWRIILPNMKGSIVTAVITTFAHTVGEFGVVLMIGGSISKSTKVVSIAIYEKVEELDFASAHIYSGILLLTSFALLLIINVINSRLNQE